MSEKIFYNNIDLINIKKYFDKNFISDLKKINDDYVNSNKNIFKKNETNDFFLNPGHYYNRNDRTILKEISEYFDRILYSPNICIIDYILKNIDLFKDKIFIDNGCGLGILSIFLEKIGIKCYNFDNFVQINEHDFSDFIYKKTNIKIEKISNIIPNIRLDVVTSSGIWLDDKALCDNNFEYILLDSCWIPESKFKVENFNLIYEYDKQLCIFKNKEI